ncbi:hypothetical protein [Anianabacter salinae]|uniref:hypothetical protein n=1 Tax=Anianabacter salinae TaxID=2851023 RepID=UPI00225E1156|nr:hypothetical protein [Anianabacter salinae]MBV0913176.1 hypothetical protein [Anianabacter salinae]
MPRLTVPFRPAALFVLLVALVAGCVQAPVQRPAEAPELGNFELAFNVVTARDPSIGPISRVATEKEWQDALSSAVAERLAGYKGGKFYHIGISIDGYALNAGGIPVLFNPRSLLQVGVTVWDDAAQRKINEKPERLIVYETASVDSVLVNTGLTKTKKEQMDDLSEQAADAVLKWLIENREWFGAPPPPEEVVAFN